MAGRAINRFDLYELCVQAPAMQARFLRALHPGRARTLAEDFAGPAAIARAWAALGPAHHAIVTDRDAGPLAHARRRAAEQLGDDAAARIIWRRRDVLRPPARPREADVIAAFNFAVCELHARADLVRYLRHSRTRLRPRGLIAADLYLGAGAWRPGVERRRVRAPDGRGSVLYEWEQRAADPLTGMVENAIHFTLPGGRRRRDVFVYRWRLWGVAELRDAMIEAGFARTEVHAGYGGAIDQHGDPVPRPVADPAEIDPENAVVYVVARRSWRSGAVHAR